MIRRMSLRWHAVIRWPHQNQKRNVYQRSRLVQALTRTKITTEEGWFRGRLDALWGSEVEIIQALSKIKPDLLFLSEKRTVWQRDYYSHAAKGSARENSHFNSPTVASVQRRQRYSGSLDWFNWRGLGESVEITKTIKQFNWRKAGPKMTLPFLCVSTSI